MSIVLGKRNIAVDIFNNIAADIFNDQFMFYHYLSKLNTNIIDYLNNNNLNLNYYCFYWHKIDNVHYILTSNTTKRSDNGCRLITIDTDNSKENFVAVNKSHTVAIFYENISIEISDCGKNICDIPIPMFNIFDPATIAIESNALNYSYFYDKNILESQVTILHNATNLNNIKMLDNLQELFIFMLSGTINKGDLPESVHTLNFGLYSQTTSANVLPMTLKNLVFGVDYNTKIDAGILPSSLQTLEFGREYNQYISVGVLPSSLQTLEFGHKYNQYIGVGVLPLNLQRLKFGYHYNQEIVYGVLPDNLLILEFGDMFNKDIGSEILPINLRELIFGFSFNQAIRAGVLPPKLNNLVFGMIF
jgi:hypothetical protein